MKSKISEILTLAALFAAFPASAQTWNSQVSMSNEQGVREIYTIALKGFKEHLAKKSKDSNIFPENFSVHQASADEKIKAPCPHPESEQLYLADLSWRWITSSLNTIQLRICKTNDFASTDTVQTIPGTHKEFRADNDTMIERFAIITPLDKGHLYHEVGDDESLDKYKMEACIPEGYQVHGWTSGEIVNSVPPGESKIQEYAERSQSKPNCVVLSVHVKGQGHDMIGGFVRSSKGGGSIGVNVTVWGSMITTKNAAIISKP